MGREPKTSSPNGPLVKSAKISKIKEAQIGEATCPLSSPIADSMFSLWRGCPVEQMHLQSKPKSGTCVTKKKKKSVRGYAAVCVLVSSGSNVIPTIISP